MRTQMHSRGVHPDEERLAGSRLTLDEIDRGTRGLVVDRFHALSGQRSGVFDLLFADPAKAWIDRWIIGVGRGAFEHAPRAEPRGKSWILGIIRIFRIFFRIQMVEIAEKLVEAVHSRQIFIAVAKMVLAELTGGIVERLQCLRYGNVGGVQSYSCAWDAHLR